MGDPRHALTHLTRLAQRRPAARPLLAAAIAERHDELAEVALDVAVETGDPVGKVLAELVAAGGSLELLERLARLSDEEPYRQTLALREVGLVATRRWLEHCTRSWRRPGRKQREILAGLTYRLGHELGQLGHLHEASQVLEQAIEHFRALPGEHRSQLATCLEYRSEVLGGLGFFDPARTAIEEAVGLRRAIFDERPETAPDLAGGLIDLCGALADLDRDREALATIEEAVAILRRRHGDRDVETQLHATALICLGNQLMHTGRLDEARNAFAEGIALQRRLAAERPTAFLAELALPLADYAILLDHLGQHEQARTTAEQAEELFHELARERQSAFGPRRAWASELRRLGLWARSGQRIVEGTRMAAEIVDMNRRLVAETPGIFEPQLAVSLGRAASEWLAADEPDRALAAADEALDLVGSLHAEGRALPTREQAWILLHRASALGGLGHLELAIADAEAAVCLFRERALREAAFRRKDLAAGLDALGHLLHLAGRFEEATEAGEEAVRWLTEAIAQTPESPWPRRALAETLGHQGNHLHALYRLDEAEHATRRAADCLRQISIEHGEAFLPELAVALSNLSLRLYTLERHAPAEAAAREAVEIFRSLPEGSALRITAHYADSLHNLGTILEAVDRDEEAIALWFEAESLFRKLLASRPMVFGPQLAGTLANLGVALGKQDRLKQATELTAEAVALFRAAIEQGQEHLAPRLAMTLNNLSHKLRRRGDPRQAVDVAREAVEILIPHLADNPEPYRDVTLKAMGHYLEALKEVAGEPEPALVTAVAVALLEIR